MTESRFITIAAFLAASLFLAATVAPVAAADAEQIFKAAGERYEQRLAAVESVTIVQEVMGVETTTRHERLLIEDRYEMSGTLSSTYRYLDHMAKNATVRGTEEVDGHECWVVDVDDLGGTHVAAEGTGDFEAQEGTLYVDQEQLVVRRMLMNGVAMRRGVKRPISMEMHLRDYREVDGWLHPFLTEVTLSGPEGGVPDDVAAMREGMAKLKEEMAKMPPEQRQQMEQMMKGRVPTFEETADSGDLKVTMIVKEIRVDEPAK